MSAALPLMFFALLLAAGDRVLFNDPLQDKLADGWSWLREDQTGHRITRDGLEIRLQSGDANTVRNALVRRAPDRSKGTYAIEVTVTSLSQPINQWEQAGLTWYIDGKPAFKLVKELVDGKVVIWPGSAPDPGKSVRLRVIVSKDSFIAQYKPDGAFDQDRRPADKGKLPPPNNDQISLQCYHGPKDKEHWIRFSDFRIVEVSP